MLRPNQEGHLRVVYPYSDEPSLSIEVRKEGYVPQRSGWGSETKKDGPPREVTIALRHGTPMGGLVIDEAGKPIEGVTVVATVDAYIPMTGSRIRLASRCFSRYRSGPTPTGGGERIVFPAQLKHSGCH